MNFIDENKESEKVVLLIHSMSFTAEAFRNLIVSNMSGDYRFIVPELASHGKSSEAFESAEKEAEKIYQYLLDNKIKKIDLAFGTSLGGIVLLRLLDNKNIIINKCVFEGCSLFKNAYLLEFFLKTFFIRNHRKAVKNKNYAIRKMSKIYGDKLGEVMTDCFIGINEESIVNIVHACTFVELPKLTKEEQEKCIFCYGSKDINLKNVRKIIKKYMPYATLKVWDKYMHCNKIRKDNLEYCQFLESQIL